MKAVVCTKYGPPEVLKLADVKKPSPKDNEILIKIHATTCHIGDVRVRGFDVPFWQKIPFRLFLGIRKPKRDILGMELSGIIEEIGKSVTKFKIGDKVYATTGFEFGAHAEYRCMAENSNNVKKGFVEIKPSNLSFEEAAAGFTTGGLTSLELLRKIQIEKGSRILVYGASGSVGVFTIQFAKYFGAIVTGVCSSKNTDMVKMLGADEVIDYTKEDVGSSNKQYDFIIDAVDKLSYSKAKNILHKNGKYLNVIKDTGSGNNLTSSDLLFIKDLAEEGKLKTVIDRYYQLEEMVEAHKYVEKGHKKGHVVIRVN